MSDSRKYPCISTHEDRLASEISATVALANDEFGSRIEPPMQPARAIQMSDLADAYISGANDGRMYPEADAERSADGYVKLFIAHTHAEKSNV